MPIEGAEVPRCPVRTESAIPRAMLMEASLKAGTIILRAPVKKGDVAAADFCGTGVNLIVTRSLGRV